MTAPRETEKVGHQETQRTQVYDEAVFVSPDGQSIEAVARPWGRQLR